LSSFGSKAKETGAANCYSFTLMQWSYLREDRERKIIEYAKGDSSPQRPTKGEVEWETDGGSVVVVFGWRLEEDMGAH